MAKIIPFAPLPIPVLKTITSPFLRFSARTGKIFPNMGRTLEQAELGLNEKEYGAILLFLVLFYMVFIGALATLLLSRMTDDFLALGIAVGFFMGFMMFIQLMMYPSLIVRKKTKSIEKNLVFALRAILVQLKSGVSLFDSMTMVAKGDYGTVSKEFQKAVDEMNAGTPEQEALEEMSEKNPSHYLR